MLRAVATTVDDPTVDPKFGLGYPGTELRQRLVDAVLAGYYEDDATGTIDSLLFGLYGNGGLLHFVGHSRVYNDAAEIAEDGGKTHTIRYLASNLAGHTTLLPGSTVRVATTVNNTATVVRTATVQVTVTAPASTVTGPTTTVSDTITLPVISTVTVTVP
jgi:hypothetical protein